MATQTLHTKIMMSIGFFFKALMAAAFVFLLSGPVKATLKTMNNETAASVVPKGGKTKVSQQTADCSTFIATEKLVRLKATPEKLPVMLLVLGILFGALFLKYYRQNIFPCEAENSPPLLFPIYLKNRTLLI